MIKIRTCLLFTVAAALVLSACPAPDAEREEIEERPDAAAVDEAEVPAADPAADPAPAAGWTVQLAGAEQGTFQGETATREDSPEGIALRLAAEAAEPPITMMLLLPEVEEGATGPFEAENASVMIGATGYFHAPDQPTQFRVDIYEHRDGRLTGTFAGTLRPDGPGDPLQLEGSFETDDAPDL